CGSLLAVGGGARRRLWLIAVSAGLVGAPAAAYAVVLWRDRLETPERVLYASLFLALAWSVVVFALAILWHAFEMRRTRASLGRLAQELRDAPEPGGLRDALAAGLADPTLVVLYWLPSRERFVDEAGPDAVLPAAGEGRAVTPITREGALIAAVVHDARLLDLPDLGGEIGSAARLAVENERLGVELRARIEEVRASRQRIVEVGDDAR